MQTEGLPEWIDVPALIAEERRLRQRLALIEQIKRNFGIDQQALGHSAGRLDARAPGRGKRSAQKAPTRLDEVVAILQQHGRPMAAKAIYEKLQEADPGIHWAQPGSVLRSFVYRAEKRGNSSVKLIGRGRYALGEWDEEKHAETRSLLDVKGQALPKYKVAQRVLEEAGAALHAKEILAQMKVAGAVVGGKYPTNSLFGMLRRYPETFVNLGRNTWDLAKRQEKGSDDD